MQSSPSTSTSSKSNIDTQVPCTLCGDKNFKTLKLLNQHKTRYHKMTGVEAKNQYIVCPLCEETTQLKTHKDLMQHIEDTHDISIEVTTLHFFSPEEFETWTKSEKIKTVYAKHRSNQRKTHKTVYYHCNKSDIKGYLPKYQKYTEKAGGTIRMKGVCPSRIVCNLYNDGKATVTFWKTHVGHDEKELRSKHLSSIEKQMVIEKLESGVPTSRILEDARKMENLELETKNVGGNSTIKIQNEEEVCQRIEEVRNREITSNQDGTAQDRDKRNIQLKYYLHWAEDLEDEDFNVVINQLQLAKRHIDEKRCKTPKKRKMDKHQYFPFNKRSKS